MIETLEHNISFSILDGILYSVANGALERDEMYLYARELVEKGKRNNIHKYLCDHRNINLKFEKIELYHVSHKLHELGFDQDDKIAILLPNDEYFYQWYVSFETSSVFHGNQVKLFYDKDEAVKWLKKQ